MSLGGYANDAFDEAVRKAVKNNNTVVTSAGNNGLDACQLISSA